MKVSGIAACPAKGFTLIELMIVMAIIGILAAIAIPQYSNMVAKSQEGTTKANLGSIRSALSIYFGDNEGWFPIDSNNLNSLTSAGRYLQAILPTNLPQTTNSAGHPPSVAIRNIAVDDAGGYIYWNGGPGQIGWGGIIVNCSHQDIRGMAWSTY
jgi:prepilin-type N-terminal cleavage/methylation domain-containing protein